MFQYPFMNHIKIRNRTKKLVLCYPPKNTFDLTVTSNSEHFSVDTNNDEEKMIFQNTILVPLMMKKMMKLKIQLSQLNHILVMQQ